MKTTQRSAVSGRTPHPGRLPQGAREDGAPSRNGEQQAAAQPDPFQAREKNGRDAQGRFAPGNLGGPGNPFARRTAQLRRVLVEAVSDDDIKEIAAMLLFKTKSGDLAAAKLLLGYVIGKPGPAVDPDGLDRAEALRWAEDTVPAETVDAIMHEMPAEVAALMGRFAVPCRAETLRQHLKGLMLGPDAADKEAAVKAGATGSLSARGKTGKSRNGCSASTGRQAASGTRSTGEADPSTRSTGEAGPNFTAPKANGTNGTARQRAAGRGVRQMAGTVLTRCLRGRRR
jgi:hypothetical protein